MKVMPGVVSVEYTLWGLDYDREYDRGTMKHFDGRSIREICNTIARLGAVDAKIHAATAGTAATRCCTNTGSPNSAWPSTTLLLPIVCPDPRLPARPCHRPGRRVKSRWSTARATPSGNYDALGFYECQWGWLMDSQPSFVTNVAEQFDFTGDMDWVRRHKSTCERVLDYLLRRDSDGDGLVEMMTESQAAGRGSDWIDVVWAAHENALVQCGDVQCPPVWADVEEVLGDWAKAGQYRACARKLKASFNKTTAEGGFWARRSLVRLLARQGRLDPRQQSRHAGEFHGHRLRNLRRSVAARRVLVTSKPRCRKRSLLLAAVFYSYKEGEALRPSTRFRPMRTATSFWAGRGGRSGLRPG